MSKEEVDETGRETWLAHSYTKAQRRIIAARADKALKLLMNACADSTDVNVARAYGKWSIQQNLLEFVGGATEGDPNGAK